MAVIDRPNLAITTSGDSAIIAVTFHVFWDAWERIEGNPYHVQVELWGEDGTLFNGGDDRIHVHATWFIASGGPDQDVTLTRLSVPKDWLDEDSGGDEIYAVVRISPMRPLSSASARTNTVRGRF